VSRKWRLALGALPWQPAMSGVSLRVPLPPPAGKWFVSTGKDNLLNAWRTPYGASIFQVCTPSPPPPLVFSTESGCDCQDGSGEQTSLGPFPTNLMGWGPKMGSPELGLGNCSGTHRLLPMACAPQGEGF
jgi:hypothetical protein